MRGAVVVLAILIVGVGGYWMFFRSEPPSTMRHDVERVTPPGPTVDAAPPPDAFTSPGEGDVVVRFEFRVLLDPARDPSWYSMQDAISTIPVGKTYDGLFYELWQTRYGQRATKPMLVVKTARVHVPAHANTLQVVPIVEDLALQLRTHGWHHTEYGIVVEGQYAFGVSRDHSWDAWGPLGGAVGQRNDVPSILDAVSASSEAYLDVNTTIEQMDAAAPPPATSPSDAELDASWEALPHPDVFATEAATEAGLKP